MAQGNCHYCSPTQAFAENNKPIIDKHIINIYLLMNFQEVIYIIIMLNLFY